MKNFIPLLLTLLLPILGFSQQSEYCEAEAPHLGIPAEEASKVIITITNQDATSMYVEIESANDDPVDLLLVLNGSGATISDEDTSVPGKIRRTLTWETPPADVTLNVLWSKVSFEGNWQLSPSDITVPFAANCEGSSNPNSVDLPITFDDSDIDYELGDFGGNTSSIVVDPTDASNMVVQSVRGTDAATFAGTTAGTNGLANPIPFTMEDTKMSVRVWSPVANIPVRLKVENSERAALSVETEAMVTEAMVWQTLEFDFSNEADGTPALDIDSVYNKVSIFFNFGATGADAGEQTYFWDDVEFILGNPLSEYCEAEAPHLGIPAEEASKVIITIANQDANSMIVEIESANDDPVDLLLVLNGSGATISDEDTSVPGKISRTLTWETPPTDVTLNVLWSKVSFEGNWQLSPSDITVPFAAGCGASGPAQVDLPINFEGTDVDYNLADFGGNTSSIVVDPTDANNMVVQSVRAADAETFAGTTAGGDGLANPIPFSASDTRMSVRVWSPVANIPVRLKVEDAATGTLTVETEAMITEAMVWQTLEFDFTNQVAETPALNINNVYDKVSIFFNFGAAGADAGEQTYFWDDVEFTGGGGFALLELPITFDEAEVDYALGDFGGNASSIVVDPTDAANMVVQSVRTASSETFAGTTAGTNGLANPIPFSVTDTRMAVRVWSPVADIPVRLKVENSGMGSISVETEAMVTTAMEWQTIEFDFANPAGGTPAINFDNIYDKVTIFFNFGTSGADAGEQTFFWDDVDFIGGGGFALVELPITFDDPEVDYNLADFGGNASSIVVDPTDAGNMVVQSIRTGGSETFAGTTAGADGLTEPIPFSIENTRMTVRVWSPVANIPIRLKVENAAMGAISVETEAMVTEAMVWQTLEFDFANQAGGTPAINLDNVYDKVTIFFNFGTSGADAGEQTFFWDDVEFAEGGGLNLLELPITFDDPDVTYDLADFAGAASSVVVDPTDASNMVAQTIRTDASEVFAGTTAGGDGLVDPIPFTANDTRMSVRVWSPVANIPVRLKVENAAMGSISAETEAMVTEAMVWQTLFFDFTENAEGTPEFNLANTYNKVTIFFNFGATGADAGEQTFFWDDVQFAEGGGVDLVELPITFDDPDVNYNLFDFAGNITSIVVDPTDNTNMVAQSVKIDVAELFAGTTAGRDGLTEPIPFSSENTRMSVRVWSPDADIPVRLKVENAIMGSISVETEAMVTRAMEWDTLVFDFVNQAPETPALDLNAVYDKVTIFFNFGTTGADAGEKIYFWDDVQFLDPTNTNVIPAADNGINIFPNPVKGQVTVEFEEARTWPVQLQIFDLQGRLMQQHVIRDQFTQLDVSTLSQGSYFMRLNEQNQSYFHKLIILD